MQSKAATPDQYIAELPEERKEAMQRLRDLALEKMPKGYKETMGYGMLCYVVPKETYPDGYHVDPSLPLGLMSIASQKNFIAVYHMGMYGDPKLLEWFVSEYPKHCKNKLDMGKSCIRFKNIKNIPFDLLGELFSKVTVDQFIEMYESHLKNK
ncbi:DUF1801 domain-containing protein [Flavobacterium sp. SUN046]|uniref:DUF1801 domain-containing protein n=1 Tax=Flavobacterium sp. SUN046 TaxID=3002440 RepID=UPI002DBDF7D7|nr:DUF1801 domain-containing protein [Flavobacterium sp. SUN046]MEC4048802.1 DUF1801 domain-containing protein [Flavobacterium sp. SUN046]